jgi:hypothetical protein
MLELLEQSPVVQWSNMTASGAVDESSNLSRATKCLRACNDARPVYLEPNMFRCVGL